MRTDRPPGDLLVIGGGIVGLSAALTTAQSGAEVTVVDWGQMAGSTANAGSLHVQMQSRILRLFPHLAPNIEAALPLYVQAAQAWVTLDQSLGGVELVRDGGLMVAESDEQLRFLDRKAARERRLGLDSEMLDRAALEQMAPYLGDAIIGAELCREEGKLNPLVANAKLRAAAIAAGVRFVNDRIVNLEPQELGVVASGSGTYRADQVILATAWGSGPLAVAAGQAIPARWEPLHMNITEPARYQLRHLVQHAERPITLKQFQSGQIVIGGGWPAAYADGKPAPQVMADSLVGNVALAARVAPGIADLRILRTWAGLNTTVDGICVLGRLRSASNVIVAIPGDAGYTLGPLCGQAAAAVAVGIEPPFDLAPYSPDRFL